ncbi:MAG: hypothetical protein Q9160_008048 [Pyrenula sp. 1 TL-2023]
MANSPPSQSRQPTKALYSLIFIATAFVRFPFYGAKYTLPSTRPNPNWSYKAAVFNQIFKVLFEFFSKIRISTPRSLEPGKDQKTFSLIEKAPDGLFQGFLAATEVPRAPIGGIWVPKRYDASVKDDSSRPVILHFHGGAYVILTPRDANTQWGPNVLCEELPAAAAFCPEYRLSSNPDGRFPAQLQDALTSHHWLVHDQGIPPSRIIFSGDSAGGHLVLMLVRYLTEHTENTLPLPRAVLLHSPWVNLTATGTDFDNKSTNFQSDYLTTALLRWGAETFVPGDTPLDSAYMSPLYHPFSVQVPVWIQVGTAEVFHADVVEWVGKMKEVPGNNVELHESADAMHDVFAAGGGFGMEEKAREGARKARDFLESVAPSKGL